MKAKFSNDRFGFNMAGLFFFVRTFRRQKTDCQKGSIFVFLVTKGNVFLVNADTGFLQAVRNRTAFCMFVHVCLRILTVLPQNHRSFSAGARAACRSEHFFSPQRAALLSACCRILVFIPKNFLPKAGVLVCFSPLAFLFEVGKVLLRKSKKKTGASNS